MSKNSVALRFGDRELSLSNLDKILYPAAKFTKAQIISYYQKISPVLLPHLRDRMLTLKRYPEGIGGNFFYEKRCPSYRPKWLKTKTVRSKKEGKDVIPYCQVEDLAGIVWVVNLASLEFHVLLSTGQDPDCPTAMVFDLDPGPPADIRDCCRVALKMKELLEKNKLESCVKTSGGKGLHLYVPLNTRVNFDDTKNFARAAAVFFQARYPKETTSVMKKSLRPGKIFIDWSQNDFHKTTVCVYSLRARTRPTVSAPLKWAEVASCAKRDDPSMLVFEPEAVLRRVEKYGDLFLPVLKKKQKLPSLQLSV